MRLDKYKRRIAILSPLGYTGLAYYDYSLCQSLANQGCSVELCTSDRWILKQKQKKFECKLYYMNCSGPSSKIWKGINYALSLNRVWQYIINSNITMVHYQIPELPVLDLLLFKKLKNNNIPIIFTPHDVIHNKKVMLSSNCMSKLYDNADAIVALNKTSKEHMIQNYKLNASKIEIIPHGDYSYFINSMSTSEARMHLAIPEDKFVILYFGNLTRSKGIYLFLESLKFLTQRREDIFVLIAGRPESSLCEDTVKRFISDTGFDGSALLDFGFIPENQVSYYYFASDLVVLPYLSISESGVLRYAQSCGRAVLCSNLQSFKEQIQDGMNGFIFNQDSPAELAATVLGLIEGSKCQKVGHQAKKLSDLRYSWDTIAMKTIELYDCVYSKFVRR